MSGNRDSKLDDGENLDFVSIPLIGLLALAATSKEGAAKYGRWNYVLGLPSLDCLNHAIRHIYMHISGDRSEPHLPHAAWNILAAIQSEELNPEMNVGELPEPGLTLGHGILETMSFHERNRDVPSAWQVGDIEEVRRIISQRNMVEYRKEEFKKELSDKISSLKSFVANGKWPRPSQVE